MRFGEALCSWLGFGPGGDRAVPGFGVRLVVRPCALGTTSPFFGGVVWGHFPLTNSLRYGSHIEASPPPPPVGTVIYDGSVFMCRAFCTRWAVGVPPLQGCGLVLWAGVMHILLSMRDGVHLALGVGRVACLRP